MANFTPIYEFTKLAEGGFQKKPNDSANYNSRGELVGTNHGIGAKTYESYLNRVVTEADMRAMTKETAKMIFKRNFWDKIQGDSIKSQKVAHLIFQEFIGSGFAGLKRVREMINKVAGKKLVQESSTPLNSSIVAIINQLPERELYDTIFNNAIRARFQIAQNPAKKEFLTGWMNRWKRKDAGYTGNPLFNERWEIIDKNLKAIGLKPTISTIKSNPTLSDTAGAALTGLLSLAAIATFFF